MWPAEEEFQSESLPSRFNGIFVMTTYSDGEWFVYMVRCADNSLYTGITTDMSRRCDQHNAGTASRYTRSRLPIRLVYEEVLTNRSLASKREAAIKALSREEKELLIRSVTLPPQTDPAVVLHYDGESSPLSHELRIQDSAFFLKEGEDILVVPIDPTGHGDDQ